MSEGYAFQVDILHHCRQGGFRLREVPITFADRQRGQTKMSRGEVGRAILMLLRVAARRLTG